LVNGVVVILISHGLPQGGPVEIDAMGVMNDTVEDSVGEGGLANDVVPFSQG
jgi:hypothetical protein